MDFHNLLVDTLKFKLVEILQYCIFGIKMSDALHEVL
jgi:hypothetical protein